MKSWIIGTALGALVAIPALAQMETPAADRKPVAPEKRSAVEARVQEHFVMLDADKDGAITRAEADAFKSRKRAEWQDRKFAMLDTDGNGQVSRAEFDSHHQDRDRDGAKGEGRRHRHHGKHDGHASGIGRFERADANGDGKVTLAEAKAGALARFDAADANKDGTLTPEERRDAWKNRAGHRADHNG